MKRSTPRVLIVGAGHLGHAIYTSVSDYCDAALLTLRLADCTSLAGYTHAVNAAGKTDLAWCEANPGEALRANTIDAIHFARVVWASGARLIHLSSGCVWDGPYRVDGEPFGPEDPPTPTCIYAWTKALCDVELAVEAPRRGWSSLRLRQPFGSSDSPRNLLTKLLGYEKLLDTPNSMTSVPTVCATVRHLIEHDLSPLWGRVSCIYDKGEISPFAVGLRLARAGLRETPSRLKKSDLDAFHKPKRVDTVLRDRVFERTKLGVPVREAWREAIRGYVKSRAATVPEKAAPR